jgi:hypothetical protein
MTPSATVHNPQTDYSQPTAGFQSSQASALSPSVSSTVQNTTNLPASGTVDFPTSAARRSEGRVVIVRKLRGIVEAIEGSTAKVFFNADGNRLRYAMPAERLLEAHVTTEGQPFEYVEGRRELLTGEVERFSRIAPLAPAESGRKVDLFAGSEYAQKSDRLLKRFGA